MEAGVSLTHGKDPVVLRGEGSSIDTANIYWRVSGISLLSRLEDQSLDAVFQGACL